MKFTRRLISLLSAVLMLFSVACTKSGGNRFAADDVSSKVSSENEQSVSPVLWRATDKEGSEIYFFGTIHIGDKRNKEIINRLHPVLRKCNALAVEFDVVAYSSDFGAQKRDLMKFVYKDGSNVRDHISDGLYEKMADFLKETKLYSKIYDNYKLGMWYQLVSQAVIKKTGLSADKAMDSLLIKEANSIDLRILEVEDPEFQTDLLANTPDDYYELALGSDLERIDDGIAEIRELYAAWLKGDEKEMVGILSDPDSGIELSDNQRSVIEDFDRRLLTERNAGMAEKAKEYVKSGSTVFFAVGIAHFLGSDGIVSLLENEGYTFTKVQY